MSEYFNIGDLVYYEYKRMHDIYKGVSTIVNIERTHGTVVFTLSNGTIINHTYCVKFDSNVQMTFAQALVYSKSTGKPIVPCYYISKDYQFYFLENGNFVKQYGNNKPKNTDLSGDTHICRTWKAYNGSYKKYEEVKCTDYSNKVSIIRGQQKYVIKLNYIPSKFKFIEIYINHKFYFCRFRIDEVVELSNTLKQLLNNDKISCYHDHSINAVIVFFKDAPNTSGGTIEIKYYVDEIR